MPMSMSARRDHSSLFLYHIYARKSSSFLTFLTIEKIVWYTTEEKKRRRDMSPLQRNSRFFASTRDKILTLLRRASRTVEELAQALDLTDNAVRAHLTVLER